MLEPQRAAAVVQPRLSASVILARPGPEALELFMVRRHARSVMAPLAYVFPGGTVRADDVEGPWQSETLEADLAGRLSERSDEPVDGPKGLGLYVAALRELFEEAGVLLARGPGGELLEVRAEGRMLADRLDLARKRLQSDRATLAEVLREEGLVPAFEKIVPFSHWVTPVGLPARFDTWFFVAAMPPRQEAIHCAIETTEGLWVTVDELIAGASEGRYEIVFATLAHLRRLQPSRTVEELTRFAERKRILRVQPTLVDGQGSVETRARVEVDEPW